MKKIKLTQGQHSIIDNPDYELISTYTWCARWDIASSTFYALTNVRNDAGTFKTVLMHRMILGLTDRSTQADHLNHDGLDNRRRNLRICTNRQNQMNTRKRSGCSSRFKGVVWSKTRLMWRSYIYPGDLYPGGSKRQIYLGFYLKEKEAAEAYDMAASKLFGTHAFLNFTKSL